MSCIYLYNVCERLYLESQILMFACEFIYGTHYNVAKFWYELAPASLQHCVQTNTAAGGQSSKTDATLYSTCMVIIVC